MRCVYCGRYFSDERIEKHQSICGNLKSARPKGLDGEQTQTGAKVFNAKAKRTGTGPSFVSPEAYRRKEEEEERELRRAREQAQKKSSWRRQHEEFVSACRAGRGEEVPPRPADHSGMIQCHHCGRHFNPEAAERHIPICANVVNRPKPPPSPARGPASPARPPSEASPKKRRPSGGRSPAPDARGGAREELPSVRSSSMGSVGGSGARAARTLRSEASDGRLPGGLVGGSGVAAKGGLEPRRVHWVWLGSVIATRRCGSDWEGRGGEKTGGRGRLGRALVAGRKVGVDVSNNDLASYCLDASRSAMMLRLLRQVPQEALSQELKDVGVSCEGLDKEGLVQAMVQQLS
ncbi:Zinc finger C2HC domain-containing protein 1C [Durusdinium trenchii]|uniref:Zinc finger C2HC domain-containing protein 1C n=1 Tax=Durusdinium trenchii TaxID=1381693 RepID=A0ABP0HEF5_9DINO